MKKYIGFFCILCTYLLIGCDTEQELIDTSYYPYSVSFFYPDDVSNNYEYAFNGVKGNSGIVSINDTDGLLEVFDKESGKSILSEKISITGNTKIQLIKLGSDIAIYNEADYISFIPTFIYSGNTADYTALFNGQILESGKTNYLSKENLTGSLEIKKIGEISPVYTSELTIAEGDKLNIMQLSETTFLDVPEDSEPDPIDNHRYKIRIFYTPDAFTADELKIDFYRCDWNVWWGEEELPKYGTPLFVKKGEISEYIELELLPGENNSFLCDITDAANPDIVFATYNIEMQPDFISGIGIDYNNGTSTYKKCTFRLTLSGGGIYANLLEGLSIKW